MIQEEMKMEYERIEKNARNMTKKRKKKTSERVGTYEADPGVQTKAMSSLVLPRRERTGVRVFR